ncbi:MAG: hypothetical protein QG594_2413 [Bacteroidota bacterium]|nr:hypothetical protein [Bacteroidota bacterium]
MKLELETTVVFLHRNIIQEGIISEIRESRSGINYEIEYLNEEEEFCSTDKNSKEVFLTVNELFQSLRNDFENKKEWEK